MSDKRLIVRVKDKITDWSDWWRLGVSELSDGGWVVWVQVEPNWEENEIVVAPSKIEALRVLDAIQDALESEARVVDLRGLLNLFSDMTPTKPDEMDTSITKEKAEELGLQSFGDLAAANTSRITPQDGELPHGAAAISGGTKHRAK